MQQRPEWARLAIVAGIAAEFGVFWAWDYVLPYRETGLVIAACGVGPAVAAWLSRPILRRLCPERPTLALLTASALVLGVAPAVAASSAFLMLEPASLTLPLAAVGGAFLWLASLALARLGPIVATAVVAAGCLWAFRVSPIEYEILPAPRTVSVAAVSPTAQRVAVIGIDSGDWAFLDPLVAAGEMPNLRRLIERGAAGVLRSTDPAASPVVWTSIFTGKTPAKHGITDWYTSHNANLRVRRLWRLIEGADLTSVVVNVPGTWPPRQSKGPLISGFPVPSLLSPPPNRRPESLGFVLGTVVRSIGAVPDVVLPVSDGTAAGRVVIGETNLPRRSRVRNAVIEILQRVHVLRPLSKDVPVRFAVSSSGRRRIQIGMNVAELATGDWSPWFREDVFGRPARFRVRALDENRFYVTPFFPDPQNPIHEFSSEPEQAKRAIGAGMYVVEGAGWRIAGDPELESVLVEHLRDVEEQHLRATFALARAVPDWKLLVHVFTLTDRTSHAFWRFADPSQIPGADPAEVEIDRERLADAYRWADAQIGDLIKLVGEDTTILIVSDHGSGPNVERRWGGHRAEGIWIAAGPGIRHRTDRVELQIYDVTPTVLALLGLPAAADMDGKARDEIVEGGAERGEITTYELDHADETTSVQIESSTKEQLRSLGYVQ